METNKTTRELAIEWFDSLSEQEQYNKCHKLGIDYMPRPTDREIEKVYLAEHKNQPKDLSECLEKKGLPETKSILDELKAINAIKKKTPPTGTVEEAAHNKAIQNNKKFSPIYNSSYNCFIAGAAWQKQQSQTEIAKLKQINRELVEVLDKIFKIEDEAFYLKSFDVKRFKTLIETTLNKAKNI